MATDTPVPTGLSLTDKSKELEVVLKHFEKSQQEQFQPFLKAYKDSQDDYKKSVEETQRVLGDARKMMNDTEFQAYMKITMKELETQREDVGVALWRVTEEIGAQGDLLQIQTAGNESLREAMMHWTIEEAETREDQKKLFEGLGEKLNNGFEKVGNTAFDAFLGPLNVAFAPIKEVFGVDLKEQLFKIPGSIGEKIGGIFGKKEDSQDTIANLMTEEASSNDKVKPNASSLIAHGGAIGAVGVYLGKLLGGDEEAVDDDRGGFLRNTAAGRAISKFGTFAAALAPAAAGLAAFAIIKKDDIMSGIERFRNGDFFGGVGDTLLGRDTSEAGTGKNMAKQGAAWGLGTLGVATSVGAVGAVAGGASLGTALATGLVAAFPPAAIAVGVAALAAGVRTAYVNEWDKRQGEVVDESRAVFQDDDASFWKKLWEGVKLTGKILLGSMAGGVRRIVDKQKEHAANIGDIWKDEEATLGKKLLVTAKEGAGMLTGAINAGADFSIGMMQTFGKYIFELLPEGAQDAISNVYDKTIGALLRGGKGLRDMKKQAMENVGALARNLGEGTRRIIDGTKQFLTDSAYRQGKIEGAGESIAALAGGVRDFFVGTFNNVKEYLGDFLDRSKNEGFFNVLGEEVKKLFGFLGDIFVDAFGNVRDTITGAAQDIEDRVRFRDLTGEQMDQARLLEQYMGDKDFAKFTRSNSSIMGEGTNALQMLNSEAGMEALARMAADQESGVFVPSDVVSVEDAILRPDGTIVKTDPNDTIYATKNRVDNGPSAMNPMTTLGMTQSVQEESGGLPGTDAIVEAVLKVVTAINDKPFNNVFQSGDSSGLDFKAMRAVGVA